MTCRGGGQKDRFRTRRSRKITRLGTDGDSPVHVEDMSSDVVGGRIKCQESGHTCNFLRLSKSFERDTSRNRLQVFFVQHGGHVRFDESGANGIDSDTAGSKLLCVGVCHTENSTLSGSIVGLARVSDLTDDRANVDDTASALLGRNFEEGLGAVEDSRQVGVDNSLPLLGLHPHDKSIAGNTCVVDQDINSTVSLNGLLEHFLDGGWVRSCFVKRDTEKQTSPE